MRQVSLANEFIQQPFPYSIEAFADYCTSPIKSVTPLYAGKTVLKLGIFPKIPTPEWESFASQRQSWEVPLEGTIQYKTKSGGEKMDS